MREARLTAEDFEVRRMQAGDLDAVAALEQVCFSDPWSRLSFESEIGDPDGIHWAQVALREGRMAGYVIGWFVLDEAHIANLAVAPMYRFLGLGRRMLLLAIGEARRREARWLGLEVRPSNAAGMALYRGLGFRLTGVRKRYYRDNGEDALVLTLDLTVSFPAG
jgi:[ribosomal protein S18]-alanine N-acetyltransferase